MTPEEYSRWTSMCTTTPLYAGEFSPTQDQGRINTGKENTMIGQEKSKQVSSSASPCSASPVATSILDTASVTVNSTGSTTVDSCPLHSSTILPTLPTQTQLLGYTEASGGIFGITERPPTNQPKNTTFDPAPAEEKPLEKEAEGLSPPSAKASLGKFPADSPCTSEVPSSTDPPSSSARMASW